MDLLKAKKMPLFSSRPADNMRDTRGNGASRGKIIVQTVLRNTNSVGRLIDEAKQWLLPLKHRERQRAIHI